MSLELGSGVSLRRRSPRDEGPPAIIGIAVLSPRSRLGLPGFNGRPLPNLNVLSMAPVQDRVAFGRGLLWCLWTVAWLREDGTRARLPPLASDSLAV